MAKFEGYLIKIGDNVFPLEYISLESYKSLPNQRTEIKAFRNGNNTLIRETSPNYKSKIEFETIEGLKLADREKIKRIIDEATIDAKERKIKITYWNDEELRYKKATVHIPNTEYIIKKISSNDIEYKPIRFAFIQY